MKLITYVGLLFFSLFNLGCVSDAVKEIDKAVQAIDNGIASIEAISGNWQNEVHKIANDIPSQLHDIIADVNALSNNLIGQAGTQVMCNLTWAKQKVVESLKNMKNRLLHLDYIKPAPGFCSVNIQTIDLNNDPRTWSSVNIFGFDLYTLDSNKRQVQAFLIENDSSSISIDERFIGRSSPYVVSINLNALIPLLVTNRFSKIKLAWNGSTVNLPELLITKWTPRIEEKFIPAFDRTWSPDAIAGPDRNFDVDPSNWAQVSVHVEFKATKNTIDFRMYMDAMEFGGDNTRVGGPNFPTAFSPWVTIFTVSDPNYEIQSYSPADNSDYPVNVTDEGQFSFNPGGSVQTYQIQIDRIGGSKTSAGSADCFVKASVRQITVVLIQKTIPM